MTKLELAIQMAANAYYKDGSSQYTDEEFDEMMEELRETQPDSELLKDGVQEELKGVSKKYKLPIRMGTLAKCMDEKSFMQMWNTHCAGRDIIIETKIDGAGTVLIYENGKLIQALSRGDTEYGEDLTENISKIQGKYPVVLNIEGFTGCIRGEFFMLRSVFNEHFKDSAKNPRNMAAGIIKRKDGSDCDKLCFIAYDLWDGIHDKTEMEKLNFLKSVGFKTPEWWCWTIPSEAARNIITIRNELKTDDEIPCDGLVIKQNIVDNEDLQRRTPMHNFAFKPSPSIRITKVKDIIWQLAGSYFAPVAIIEPVELCGTTVERASLANVNIMNELGIYIGASVAVKKAGEIIPSVVEVVSEKKKDAFEVPTVCPVCGGKVEVNDSGIPVCVNTLCPRKVSHRFAKMFDILGVKGAGDAFISYMEEKGVTVSDFFEIIARKDEETLNRFAGGINGGKILKQMIKVLSKPISTAKFLAIFDYKGFDEKKLKLINKPLDEMFKLTFEDLVKIDGFAEKTASLFLSFMHDCKDEIEDLKHYFIIEDAKVSDGKLNGLSFCFTGAACKPRSVLQQMVEENGGVVKSGVAKGLSYLVTDDTESNSAKNVKAKSLNIPVISSMEFLKMVE
jgi:DNA ligase (NAD+)